MPYSNGSQAVGWDPKVGHDSVLMGSSGLALDLLGPGLKLKSEPHRLGLKLKPEGSSPGQYSSDYSPLPIDPDMVNISDWVWC